MSRRTIAVAVALSTVVVGAGSSCAIRTDSTPNDIPEEQSAIFGEPARGDEAAGSNRIFLLAPGTAEAPQSLRSVSRDVPASAAAVLGSLFAGPNADERDNQLDTAIPTDVQLQATRTLGSLLTVDVNDVFGDLTPEGLRLAVAQIVASATQIEGIEEVQLRIDGEPRVWPLGNGQLTDRPLTVYDYPGLVESSQPAFPAVADPQA